MTDNIQVVRRPDNHITLTAKCESIKQKINGIISLNKKLSLQTQDQPDIEKITDTLCVSDITSIIPARILDLHDKTTAYPGANCWNTSLYTNKIVQSRRATAESEMTYWMNSPLCRELKNDEEELPGDIIAIRTNYGNTPIEMHGFVYLTSDFSFSKSGFDIQFPYEFTSSEYVYHLFALGDYEEYSANKECRRVEGIPNADKCPVFANVFRCMSYAQYLEASDFPSKDIYKKLDNKLLSFEKKLSEAAVIARNFTSLKSSELNIELTALESEYLRDISNHIADSILWDSIKERIISFHTQIDLLNDELVKD